MTPLSFRLDLSGVAVCLALLWSAPSAAQDVWRTTRIAEGVYASVVDDPEIYSAFSNSLIIVGEDGVLVVDPRESAAAGRALLEEIRSITDQPVRWVVNSHWHWDHLGGNQAFMEAFPEVQIITHPETARLLEEEGQSRFDAEVQRLVDRRERLLEIAERGTTDSGRTLTAEDRATIDGILARDEVRRGALEETRLVGATRFVEDRLSLDVGQNVIVIAPEAAHTPGDLVVWLPEGSVLYAGDLVEHGFPWVGDGNAYAMAESLDDLGALDPDLVLPGHGPVPEDGALFDGQRAYWRSVRELADEVPVGDPLTSESLQDPAGPWPEAIDRLIDLLSPETFPGAFDPEGIPTTRLRGFVEESLLQAVGDKPGR